MEIGIFARSILSAPASPSRLTHRTSCAIDPYAHLELFSYMRSRYLHCLFFHSPLLTQVPAASEPGRCSRGPDRDAPAAAGRQQQQPRLPQPRATGSQATQTNARLGECLQFTKFRAVCLVHGLVYEEGFFLSPFPISFLVLRYYFTSLHLLPL